MILKKLKQAALNATQGEWMRLFGERTMYDRLEDGCRGNAIVRADTCFTEQDTKNLNHIATANPSTVIELIHRLEDAESQLASQELVIQQLRDHIADSADTAAIALRKAWQLGQTYWQQADSESYSQQDKSPATQERFSKLVSDTCVEINEALAIPNSTKHLEAWYKEMVDKPVGHFYEAAEHSYNQCWSSDAEAMPFHAIKPFPFKG